MRKIIDLSTFTPNHSGGKDEVAYNLLRGFSDLGHTDDFIVVVRPGVDKIVKEIDCNYDVVILDRWVNLSAPGLIIGFFTDLLYAKKLKKIVKQFNVDCVLYSNKFIPSKKVCNKTIMIPHDIQCYRNKKELHVKSLIESIQCRLLFFNYKVCDYVVAISDYDKSEMQRYLPGFACKIKRIYDPIVFKPKLVSESKPYITALNIQWEQKNVITLIKAYVSIANRINEDLILVGKTSFSDTLQNEIDCIISSNNLENRIYFTGFVSSEKLNDIISKTRIYVNPSLYEGFGMTAVEMMGSCVPTIVNTDTALPESTMGLCRYYEPARDYNALADQLLEELNNPTSISELNDISDKIRSNYDYLKISQEYLDLLGE